MQLILSILPQLFFKYIFIFFLKKKAYSTFERPPTHDLLCARKQKSMTDGRSA
jgi:hypothetical protein